MIALPRVFFLMAYRNFNLRRSLLTSFQEIVTFRAGRNIREAISVLFALGIEARWIPYVKLAHVLDS